MHTSDNACGNVLHEWLNDFLYFFPFGFLEILDSAKKKKKLFFNQ